MFKQWRIKRLKEKLVVAEVGLEAYLELVRIGKMNGYNLPHLKGQVALIRYRIKQLEPVVDSPDLSEQLTEAFERKIEGSKE